MTLATIFTMQSPFLLSFLYKKKVSDELCVTTTWCCHDEQKLVSHKELRRWCTSWDTVFFWSMFV